MADSTVFGERVRQLMGERELSMRRLAPLLPCSVGYLSRVINGQKSPSEQLVKRLDAVLDAHGEIIDLAPKRNQGNGHQARQAHTSSHLPNDQSSESALDGQYARPAGVAGPAVALMPTEQHATKWGPSAPSGGPAPLEPLMQSHAMAGGDLISAIVDATRAHVELAEVTEVGPGTLEQLRVDVIDIARAYVFTPPFPLFLEMNRVRGRIIEALSRKSHPSQERELYFFAGCLSALLANACLDLDRCKAGDDLARAAWTYGTIIDHHALIGWARGIQALAALLDGRPDDAVRYANDGLDSQHTGPGGARLYSISARALACRGSGGEARNALMRAKEARLEAHSRDLHHQLGGEFAFSEAKQQYYEAVTYVRLADPQEAARAASMAIRHYEDASLQDRSYGCEALARSQLALARLMSGELDGAGEALQPVLTLAPEQRINSLTGYLDTGRKLLHDPRFLGSHVAKDLDERLALFCTNRGAPALTSGWNEHSTRKNTRG